MNLCPAPAGQRDGHPALARGSGRWRPSLRPGGLWTALALAMWRALAAPALTLDEIQFWAGAGTNRAAMIIHWSAPEARTNTAVPDPVADQSRAWGYRWNGVAQVRDLFHAILAADQQLFAVLPPADAGELSVLGFGYDANNNGRFGLRQGTNLLTGATPFSGPAAFTNGLVRIEPDTADAFESLDVADWYWGGWHGPTWELWVEAGGQGGFSNAPVRGDAPYWTPANPQPPDAGQHGQWQYVSGAWADLPLHDGAWLGWTVAASGWDPARPNDAAAMLYHQHKRAPAPAQAAWLNSSPYASELIAATPPWGPAPYDDPLSVLGEPTALALNFDPFLGYQTYRIKLVEAAYNRAPDGQKLLLTLNRTPANGDYAYSAVTVKFDRPIEDNPAHPYGVDFQVFGNAFYTSSGFTDETADMQNCHLTGGVTTEPMRVSVSPDGLNWYTYTNGPFADTAFPTHAFAWDAGQFQNTGLGWTAARMDFTKPVNPVFNEMLGNPGSLLSAAEAIELYAGSGGGTGFDLAESGFAWIQYVRVAAAAGYYAGEIDAFAAVRPMRLGEALTIAPANLTNSASTLFFQSPAEVGRNAVQMRFQSINQPALVTATRFPYPDALTALAFPVLASSAVTVQPLLEAGPLAFQATLQLDVGPNYDGDGSDLATQVWDGSNWTSCAFTFDIVNGTLELANLTDSVAVAVTRLVAPPLHLVANGTGFVFSFQPRQNWKHTLERTTNFTTWIPVAEVTPAAAAPVELRDEAPPAARAFYRLKLEWP
ncbi:MAG TPA: hypothetical protein PKN95_03575 [Verrucomicrobiota bacterium]|nr:hypothetical protein [Verrucomicrobiota bacterium]HNT14384.1 hypothetical protein [Verrucomicrobiota bacterium]